MEMNKIPVKGCLNGRDVLKGTTQAFTDRPMVKGYGGSCEAVEASCIASPALLEALESVLLGVRIEESETAHYVASRMRRIGVNVRGV